MSDKPFDPRGFVREIMERATSTLDAMDTDQLAEKYGLLEARPLTAEQIADKDGPWNVFWPDPEWPWEVGDEWCFWTDEFKAWLDEREERICDE